MSGSTSADAVLDAAQIAELNDLLRLSQRAVATYSAMIPKLTNVGRRQTLMRFRADHQRVAAELAHAIRQGGGTPIDPPAVEQLAPGNGGGDRELMSSICRLARKARAHFVRTADRLDGMPAGLRERLGAAAEDIARQCEWADTQLRALGGAMPDRVSRIPGIAAVRRRLEALPSLPALPARLPSNRALATGAVAAGLGFAIVATVGALRARR
jgi:hypothetical protein